MFVNGYEIESKLCILIMWKYSWEKWKGRKRDREGGMNGIY